MTKHLSISLCSLLLLINCNKPSAIPSILQETSPRFDLTVSNFMYIRELIGKLPQTQKYSTQGPWYWEDLVIETPRGQLKFHVSHVSPSPSIYLDIKFFNNANKLLINILIELFNKQSISAQGRFANGDYLSKNEISDTFGYAINHLELKNNIIHK